ncbi:MAG: glycosyltransferase family 9 protein [Leptolyngbya sp. SIO3F4]|nr:glycosyltransferase family 9 protein [Leptolyngbya sp. SIO3F4]
MQLFSNEPLRPQPHIAVLSSSKLGNFVITTPLLRGLKEKYPDCSLDFFGSNLTQGFEVACSYIDWRTSILPDAEPFLTYLSAQIAQRRQEAGAYDLVINCDEFNELNSTLIRLLAPHFLVGGATDDVFCQQFDYASHPVQRMLLDVKWNAPDFVQRYGDVTTSQYIAELFCRLAYVDTDFFKLELPSEAPDFTVPDILIHVTAARSAKLWFGQAWQTVVNWCVEQGFTVGLVGSKPERQQELYHAGAMEDKLLEQTSLIDLRGKTSLPQLAGTLKQTKLFICVDTGPLHIAAAVGCPTIGIFGNDVNGYGASPVRIWAPREDHVTVVASEHSCKQCELNNFRNHDCLLQEKVCMQGITPDTVIRAIKQKLNLNQTVDYKPRRPGSPMGEFTKLTVGCH